MRIRETINVVRCGREAHGDEAMTFRTVRLVRCMLCFAVALCCCALMFGCRQPIAVPSPSTSGLPKALQAAFERARAAVTEDPKSATEWGRMGKLCMAHQFFTEAIACFEKAEALDPNDPRWSYFQAVMYEEVDLEKSSQLYGKSLKAKSDSAITRFRLGQVLVRLGQFEGARAEFQRVVELEPNQPSARLALARLDIATANWSEAETQLRAAVGLAPNSRALLQELSRVAAHKEEWVQALQFQNAGQMAIGNESAIEDVWLQEITDLEMSGHPAADRADRFLAEGQLNAAAAALRDVVREHPELPRARQNLAVVLWQLGQTSESQREFHQLVSDFPDEATAYLAWGRLLAAAGRFQEAKLRLEQAIERKADTGEGCAMMGRISEKLGLDEEAVTWFQRSVRASPQVAATRVSLAMAYRQLGKLPEARAALQAAANLAADDDQKKQEIVRLLRQVEDDLNRKSETPR